MTPREDLAAAYKRRHSTALTPLAKRLQDHIEGIVKDQPKIDRVVARAKSPKSFLDKATRLDEGKLRYPDPLNQIQDQIAARIVTFYLSDVPPLAQLVLGYFGPVEERDMVPESPSEFGYEGKHYVLFLPKDLVTPELPREDCPTFFELQIKTLFQHAWAQADHDLAYKPAGELTRDQKRKVAFTAAQAWGADVVFGELASELAKSDAV